MITKHFTGIMATALLLSSNGICAEVNQLQSWNDVDVSDFNKAIDNAVANGADWVTNPMKVALYVFNDDANYVDIHQEPSDGAGGEYVGAITISATYSGYMDDSVYGSHYELNLIRAEDYENSTWKVERLRVAYQCARGNPDVYVSGPCP